MTLIRVKKNGECRPVAAAPMFGLRGDFDHMFERLFREPLSFERARAFEGLEPAIDVAENETQVIITADVPGIDPEKIDVTVDEDTLTIAGEKEESEQREGVNIHHSERRFGSFRRQINLPGAVNPEKVDATFKQGVLTVSLEKASTTVARKIAVRAN